MEKAARRDAMTAEPQTPRGAAGTIEGKMSGAEGSGVRVEEHTAESIAPSIEALLLSIDKPLAPYRIAQALGLVAEDDPRHADHPLMADAQPAKAEGQPSRKRGGKRASPITLVAEAIGVLNGQYEQSGRAFRVEEVAGGYRVMTLPEFAPVLEAYHGRRERASLSRAAIETLAIIAYKQPMTRAALEAIRGVACGEILRSLMERRLVTITGRAEELGRPMLYGTSRQFLEVFGLTSLKDLPSVEEFKQRGGVEEQDD